MLLRIVLTFLLFAGAASVRFGGAAAQPAPFVLGPPPSEGPVVVRAFFDVGELTAIHDDVETFEFTGVLTLRWSDPRQAFDPMEAGVAERVYQGSFQFDEISPGWFPQFVLVNEAGSFDVSAVVLRVTPAGDSTMAASISATARAELDMRQFPLDSHRLRAEFQILGFGSDEVRFEVDGAASASMRRLELPQWKVLGTSLQAGDGERRAGMARAPSSLRLLIDVERESFYTARLVVLPLLVIVALSFSVFWMDRSSLGDRLNVSFIGILTGVAYQILMSDQLPKIAYFTLMHAFLSFSFVTMSATVVINLVVASMDKKGQSLLGDRIDRACRWQFPIVYVGVLILLVVGTLTLFEPGAPG